MNFPNRITTKREAQTLAAELFPGTAAAALAKLPPGTTLPRYQLTHTTADTLRNLMLWLHEQRPKIYKRARWHLFYDVALRLVTQTDENGSLKWSDLDLEHRSRAWKARTEAETMRGDGSGI